MPADLWTLPGPQRFINRTINTILEGRSPVLVLPSAAEPGGLMHALRQQVGAESLSCRTIDPAAVVKSEGPPASAFGHQLGVQAPAPGVRERPERIAEDARVRGLTVLADLRAVPDGVDVQQWWRLLRTLTNVWRESTIADRGGVCTLARADQLPDGLSGDLDVLIPVRWWWGIINRVDTILHAASLVDDDGDPTKVAVLTEVAQFDLRLVTHLFEDWDLTLGGLAPALERYRRTVSLPCQAVHEVRCPLDQPAGEVVSAWAGGLQERWGVNPHPANHAANDQAVDGLELRSRVWAGQASVLLPEIERARWQLIRWIQSQPSSVRERLATNDWSTVEVTELKERIKSHATLRQDRQRLELSEWLSAARNDLAHLQPLEQARINRGLHLMERASERL